MKKAGLSSILPLLLLVVSPVYAENITTGDSTAHVEVHSNVQSSSTNNSSSNVHTHIEVETNGEKKVLDEDGPGDYSVTSNTSGGETSVHVTSKPQNPTNGDETSTKSADEDKDNSDDTKDDSHKGPVEVVIEVVMNVGGFFLRIFRNL